MNRLAALSRSMLVQMVLLTALFVGGGVYIFAVRPLLDMPRLQAPDLTALTVARASEIIGTALLSGEPPAQVAATIAADPGLREVARRNPEFRYAVIVGDVGFGTARPLYYRSLGLDRITEAKKGGDPSICVQMERAIPAKDGPARASYFNCGTVRYFEVRGITRPIDLDLPTPWQAYGRWLWSYSRPFLLPALGMFAICMAILVLHILTIRRMARLIRPLADDSATWRLPERKFPGEVRPLVHALNTMVDEVAAVEARQRFFLSAAAHEMRTPLTVLRTRLEEVDEGPLKTKLISDVRRLSRLVNNLLSLMSIRARTQPVGQVDVVACCRRTIAALTTVAAAKSLSLNLEKKREHLIVTGDAALIEVAITNLVDNAIAFSPTGAAITITIGSDACVTVQDAGPGIADAQATALFDPFIRFSKKPGGYGLGLTIVKAITDLHGATIEVTNVPGGGGRFTVRFATMPDSGRDA